MAPCGPLYSRKPTPRPQAPRHDCRGFLEGPCNVHRWFRRSGFLLQDVLMSRSTWMCVSDPAAINPNATTKDKRARCMGCPFAGIKRTAGKKGSEPTPFSRRPPSRKGTPHVPRPPATNQTTTHSMLRARIFRVSVFRPHPNNFAAS